MYQKTVLDNGLRVVTETMPYTQAASLSIFIGTGSRYEADAEAGISHFLEHLLFKGTEKRPTARDISEAIEGVGGMLNGGTDKEFTVYWCKVPRPHFVSSLDVLVDLMLNSRFDPAEIEKERQVIIEEINMSMDSPQTWVNLLVDRLLWPGHSLGRDVAGTRESVSAISREQMLGYLSSRYQPANTVVAIAGNIPHEEALAAVKQYLGKWPARRPAAKYTPYRPKPVSPVLVEKRDIEQVHLCLALPGLSLFHPRRFALDLLNVILGEGMSSRLFYEIRDKLGLAYSIHSYADHFLDSGSMVIYAGVDIKNLSKAVKAILEQLALLKDYIPEAELTKARELSKGRLLLRLEDSRNVSGWLGGQEVMAKEILTPEQVVAIIESITADELKQLARELFVSSQLRLAVVGPVKQDEPLAGLLRL